MVWGLDATGHFKSDEDNQSVWRRQLDTVLAALGMSKQTAGSGSVAHRVLMDLNSVHLSLRLEEESAAIQSLSNREKGKRLMFLFQRDLLPGVSGKILESKGQRDNIAVTFVSWQAKVAGWTFIGLLNVGMLFYILLFAVSQTAHRQGAWALSFALWLVVEILFVSSAVVVFTHIFIPSLIMKDVNKIKAKLVDSIRAFNASIKQHREGDEADNEEEQGDGSFSTTDYLFVSSRMAKKWSELREAKIIAQFRTPWPKQSYQREVNVSKSYSKKFSAFTRSASILAMFFLTNLVQVPPSVQDMLVQMCTTTALGYTILLHINLYKIFPVLVIIPLCIVATVVHFIIRSNAAAQQKSLDVVLNSTGSNSKGIVKITAVRDSGIHTSHKSSIVVAEERELDEEEKAGSDDAFDEATNLDGELHTALHLAPGQSPRGGPIILGRNRTSHISRRASIQQGLQVLRDLQQQKSVLDIRDADNAAQSSECYSISLSSSDSDSHYSGSNYSDSGNDGEASIHQLPHASTAAVCAPPTNTADSTEVVVLSTTDSAPAAARRLGVGADVDSAVRSEVRRAVHAQEWAMESCLSLNSDQEQEMDRMFEDFDDIESDSSSSSSADTDSLIEHFMA